MTGLKVLPLFLPLLVVTGSFRAETTLARPAVDPGRFTIDQVLSPACPYGLVAARKSDRLAWIENERGMRNVYTAAAPDFTPVRLTAYLEDDEVSELDREWLRFVSRRGTTVRVDAIMPPSADRYVAATIIGVLARDAVEGCVEVMRGDHLLDAFTCEARD